MFSLCLANAVCGFESAIYICSFFSLFFQHPLHCWIWRSILLKKKKEWRKKRHQLQNGKIQEMRVAIVFTRQRFFSSRFITSHPPFLASSRSWRELHPLKRWRKSHLSVARKESQSRVPARREPSSCFHAPYHYLSWSLFWFWSWRSSVWWGIFIFGLPATSVTVKGTRRNIRLSPMRNFRCKRWKLPPILPFFKDKRRMESRLNTTTSASSEDNSSQATAIFVHKKWCCSAT